jgi:hypothetical protein
MSYPKDVFSRMLGKQEKPIMPFSIPRKKKPMYER